MKKDSRHYSLLISLNDPIEAFNIRSLLESGGIDIQEMTNVSGPYLRELDGPLPQIDKKNLATARKLLSGLQVKVKTSSSKERVSTIARLTSLLLSLLFFVLYLNATTEKGQSIKYVLLGLSIIFVIIFLLAIWKRRGKCDASIVGKQ